MRIILLATLLSLAISASQLEHFTSISICQSKDVKDVANLLEVLPALEGPDARLPKELTKAFSKVVSENGVSFSHFDNDGFMKLFSYIFHPTIGEEVNWNGYLDPGLHENIIDFLKTLINFQFERSEGMTPTPAELFKVTVLYRAAKRVKSDELYEFLTEGNAYLLPLNLSPSYIEAISKAPINLTKKSVLLAISIEHFILSSGRATETQISGFSFLMETLIWRIHLDPLYNKGIPSEILNDVLSSNWKIFEISISIFFGVNGKRLFDYLTGAKASFFPDLASFRSEYFKTVRSCLSQSFRLLDFLTQPHLLPLFSGVSLAPWSHPVRVQNFPISHAIPHLSADFFSTLRLDPLGTKNTSALTTAQIENFSVKYLITVAYYAPLTVEQTQALINRTYESFAHFANHQEFIKTMFSKRWSWNLFHSFFSVDQVRDLAKNEEVLARLWELIVIKTASLPIYLNHVPRHIQNEFDVIIPSENFDLISIGWFEALTIRLRTKSQVIDFIIANYDRLTNRFKRILHQTIESNEEALLNFILSEKLPHLSTFGWLLVPDHVLKIAVKMLSLNSASISELIKHKSLFYLPLSLENMIREQRLVIEPFILDCFLHRKLLIFSHLALISLESLEKFLDCQWDDNIVVLLEHAFAYFNLDQRNLVRQLARKDDSKLVLYMSKLSKYGAYYLWTDYWRNKSSLLVEEMIHGLLSTFPSGRISMREAITKDLNIFDEVIPYMTLSQKDVIFNMIASNIFYLKQHLQREDAIPIPDRIWKNLSKQVIDDYRAFRDVELIEAVGQRWNNLPSSAKSIFAPLLGLQE